MSELTNKVTWREWLAGEQDDPDNPIGPTISGRCAKECSDHIDKLEECLRVAIREADEWLMEARGVPPSRLMGDQLKECRALLEGK